jgi:hypothetical protein
MSPALMTPHTPVTMSSLVLKSADANPFEATLEQDGDETPVTGSRLKEARLVDESSGPVAAIFNNVLRYIDGSLLDLLQLGERIREKQQSRSKVPTSRDLDKESEHGEVASPMDDAPRPTESSFEFMANSIWTPVAERIMSELGGVLFANGRVTELHQVSWGSSVFGIRIALIL